MTEVSTYVLDQRIRTLESRVETIEDARLEDLKNKVERERRKTEALGRWMTFGFVLVAAVSWTVIITLAITGQ